MTTLEQPQPVNETLRFVSSSLLIGAFALSGLSIAWLVKDPAQWVSGLRFSIVFSPYSPTYRDTLFYCMFYIFGYFFKFKQKTPIVIFFAWALDEASNVLVNGSQIPLYMSIDPYYLVKAGLFGIAFIVSVWVMRKSNIRIMASLPFAFALMVFFLFFEAASFEYTVTNNTWVPPLAFLYHAVYLVIIYGLVGIKKQN